MSWYNDSNMSVAIARSGWRCTPPAAPSEAAARAGKAGALDVQRGQQRRHGHPSHPLQVAFRFSQRSTAYTTLMTVMGKGNRSTVPGSIVFQLSHTVPVSAGSVEVLAIAGCVLAGSCLLTSN